MGSGPAGAGGDGVPRSTTGALLVPEKGWAEVGPRSTVGVWAAIVALSIATSPVRASVAITVRQTLIAS